MLYIRVMEGVRRGYTSNVPDVLTVISFVVFYLIKNMCQIGFVENNLNLIDLEKAKPWELPIKFFGSFIKEVAAQFKCMGERNFVLNSSTAFVWAWKTIKTVLNEGQSAKTVLVGENTCKELKEIVCQCQLL